jgi:hypothetical protein
MQGSIIAQAIESVLMHEADLGIAVYHHPADFWRVFESVTALRSDYNLYLRHYTEGWTEMIMYSLPRR